MSDLISREDALMALTGVNLPTERDKLIALFDERIKALSTVEPQGFEDYLKQYLGENDLKIIGNDAWEETKAKAEQTEWISVKDSRKPKIRERVWVTDCDGEVWIMYYNDCDCYFSEFGDVFTEDDIIAWRPITVPSPYKGDEDERERVQNNM